MLIIGGKNVEVSQQWGVELKSIHCRREHISSGAVDKSMQSLQYSNYKGYLSGLATQFCFGCLCQFFCFCFPFPSEMSGTQWQFTIRFRKNGIEYAKVHKNPLAPREFSASEKSIQ